MVTTLACLACLVARDATPEATVQGVFDALNNHNWKAVFQRFEGAKVDEIVPAFEKIAGNPVSIPKFLLKMSAFTVTGDSASGNVSVGTQMNSMPNPMYQEDEVHLHRVNGDWKIVDGRSKNSMFTQFGQVARDPKLMDRARTTAQNTVVLSNLKQISLGIIMYANDHNDKFEFNQATLRTKIDPYLKNANVWKGPDGKPLDVRLNPTLAGKSMTSIAEPANCVMLSIGPKDKLQYFQDRTPIAYVDGHVKFLDKVGASKLMWK